MTYYSGYLKWSNMMARIRIPSFVFRYNSGQQAKPADHGKAI